MRIQLTALGLCAAMAGLAACAPAPVALPENGSGGSDSGSDSDLEPLDMARLDRSLSEGPCGYPGEGSSGYGTEVGQRLANSQGFTLVDCEGTQLSLADYMCERGNTPGDFNRGVLFNIGAGWCGPCQEETLELPELYEEFHGRGIEIVQVMFQDWDAQAPTRSFCEDWSSGQWEEGGLQGPSSLPYPVLLDQIFDWTNIYLQDPQSATPVNLLVDANGNIRWKSEGQKVGLDTLRTQFNLILEDPYGAQ